LKNPGLHQKAYCSFIWKFIIKCSKYVTIQWLTTNIIINNLDSITTGNN